jgi:putative flippase GtrA
MHGYTVRFAATAKQFLRFILVGATGTTLHYLVLWAGVEIATLPAALASSAGYIAGSVVNYLLNYQFTFFSTKAHRIAIVQFYVLVGAAFLFNGALMLLLAHGLNWPWLGAQIVTTAVCLVWNFVGCRWWVFRG